MEILFRIGGEEHTVTRDERLDKILITDADQITQQHADEDAKRLEADPKFEPRLPVTAGMYAESLIMPTFDGLLKVEDDRRKAEIGAKYDQVDEKTKIFVTALNKWAIERVLAGDTASVEKLVTATGIPIDK